MDASRSLTFPRPGLAILIMGVALAAGLGTPWFLDYDEAVYADVARQMSATGDWLRPVSNCEPFYEKPILFYWLIALLYKLLGFTPLAPRLVSALALLLGLAFLAREVARRATPEAAEIAVWVAGASLLPFSLGRIGLLDALLTTTMTVALLAFLRALGEEESGHRRRALALGYVMTGTALAVKGPVFPVLIAGILLCDALAQRDVGRTLRRSGVLWGVPLLLAVGLPPYVLASRAAGPSFLTEFLGEHNLGRALTAMQGHQGSLLYYLGILVAGLLPFSAFLPQALLHVRRADRVAGRLGSFAGAWGLLVIVMFSLAATKLPNYIAPAVPALAIVVALALAGDDWKLGAGWNVTVVLCVGFSLLVASLPALLARLPGSLGTDILKRAPELAHLPQGPWPRLGFLVAAALLGGGSVWARHLARRDRGLRAVRVLGITGALAWSVLLISAGQLVDATSIAPVRHLAIMAARGLPPGAPIHVVEMNHRITQNLATGRCTVYLRARTSAQREEVHEILARDGAVRMIMGDFLWQELRRRVGGREIARNGAYVLVAGD